jgi:hypothetical protein
MLADQQRYAGVSRKPAILLEKCAMAVLAMSQQGIAA